MTGTTGVWGIFQISNDLPDIVIEHLDHCAIIRILLPLQRPTGRIARVIDSQFLAILFKQGLAPAMDWRVHQPSRVVQKEGLVLVRLHEIECVESHLILGKAIRIQAIRIGLCLGCKTGQAMRSHGPAFPKIMPREIKALVLGLRKCIVIDRHMPFARMTGNVSVGFQRLGNRNVRKGHTTTVPRIHHGMGGFVVRRRGIATDHMSLLSRRRMPTAHDCAPSRGASRSWRIPLAKKHALFCQGINIRGFHGGRGIDVVALDILPAQVIDQEQNDVGTKSRISKGRI